MPGEALGIIGNNGIGLRRREEKGVTVATGWDPERARDHAREALAAALRRADRHAAAVLRHELAAGVGFESAGDFALLLEAAGTPRPAWLVAS